MLNWLLAYAMTASAAAGCILAIWKGGPAERAGGILIGGAWLASLLVYPIVNAGGSPYATYAPYLPVAIDGVVAVGLLGLALRYSSAWLGVAVFLQAAELALHAAFLIGDGSGARAYIARVNILGSALILLLLFATVRVWLRGLKAQRAAVDTGQVGAPTPTVSPLARRFGSSEGGDGFPGKGFDAAPVPVAHRLVRR